jgi:tetratricopeptide (TPR) repeat protein
VTPSLAAYRKYVDALPDSLPFAQSAALLREAVALDSDFAAAWARLGFALHQIGLWEESRAAYLTARRLAHRLTPHERLTLDANIARDVDLDSEAAVSWWDRVVAEEPTLASAYHERAFPLTDIARYDEAIASCRRAITLSPSGPRNHISLCSAMMAAVGRTSEARALSSRLEGENKWHIDVSIASAESDWSRLEALATAPPFSFQSRYRASNALAASQAARGQVAEARESLRRTKSVFGYPGGPVSLLELLLAVASSGTPDQYELPPGFHDGAVTPAATGLRLGQWNRMLFPMWAAWRGDTKRAEREYRAFEADTTASSKMGVEVAMMRAWIDSREGRWQRVPRLLATDAWNGINGGAWWWGSLNLRRWLVAEAYERTGRPDSAAAFFRTLTRATRSNWPQADSRGLVHSFALRRLASLEEQMGQSDSARIHWQQFLQTFTRPDPEFRPLVAEAELKVARIRTP